MRNNLLALLGLGALTAFPGCDTQGVHKANPRRLTTNAAQNITIGTITHNDITGTGYSLRIGNENYIMLQPFNPDTTTITVDNDPISDHVLPYAMVRDSQLVPHIPLEGNRPVEYTEKDYTLTALVHNPQMDWARTNIPVKRDKRNATVDVSKVDLGEFGITYVVVPFSKPVTFPDGIERQEIRAPFFEAKLTRPDGSEYRGPVFVVGGEATLNYEAGAVEFRKGQFYSGRPDARLVTQSGDKLPPSIVGEIHYK